jgi:hypothetical protein
MKNLLVILIDAFRYDYLSSEDTPFLHSIARKNPCLPLQPILGYSDSIRATIFTGVYPEDHNYWGFYKYSPETSPFRFFKRLSPLDAFPDCFIKRGFRFGISKTICKLLAKSKGYSELNIQNIPFGVIDFFDYTLKNSMFSEGVFGDFPTIFDILKNNEVKSAHIDSSKFGWSNYFSSIKKVQDQLLSFISNLGDDVQFIFVYLHHLDHFAHRHNTKSQEFMNELKCVDETTGLIVNEFKNKHSDGNIVIFSDHGMADTTDFVNFEWLKKEDGFGKDFLFVLDSTMVRLWYFNDKGKEIKNKFNELDYGSFLSEIDKDELHINFAHRFYGEDIYLLKPGYSIFPNFVSWLIPYAMHAYHPREDSQTGIAMFMGEELQKINKDREPVQLIEFMPTIMDYFDIDIPETCRGVSLLR